MVSCFYSQPLCKKKFIYDFFAESGMDTAVLGIEENKVSERDCKSILRWFCSNYSFRITDFPFSFKQEFKRYDGKS